MKVLLQSDIQNTIMTGCHGNLLMFTRQQALRSLCIKT